MTAAVHSDKTMDPVAHFQAEHARWLDGLAADPLRAEREAALARFAAAGLPHRRIEEWKYTDVQPIARVPFTAQSVPAAIDTAAIDRLRLAELEAYELVFVNGRFHAELSRLDGGAAGIRIQSLAAALADAGAAVAGRFGSCVHNPTHAFTDLNTAFVQDGALIDIATDVQIDRPIVLLYLDRAGRAPGACHPRNLIRLGRNASATVVESYIGLDDEAENLTNSVTEIDLGTGARLDHYRIGQQGLKSFHVGGVHVRQARDSRYASHSIALGGRLARVDINTRLEAEGASALLNGLYLVGGRQHVDHHTRIDHLKPHTTSEETYRGVLDGNARAVFNGKVYVHPGAQKTDARQSNANLLLSKTAEVDTKPELEIYADDVKCSHGATVGQLDENALFYLRSRAIDEPTARKLLTYAFAREIVARIGLVPIRTRLERIVLGRLPGTDQIGEFV